MRLELLTRAIAAQRRSAIVWALALLALTASVLAVWPAMNESGSLDSLTKGLSPELIAALGLGSLASPAGFLNGNLFALLLPLVFGVLGIMHTNALTAADEDAGRLELLLALPVSRVGVYLSRFVAVALVLAVNALLVGATVLFGAPAFDMELETEGVIAATLSLYLLALLHAGLVLALAGVGLRGGVVLAISFGVLVLGYLAHALLPMIESVSKLSGLSPWHWALGESPLENGYDWTGSGMLLASAALLVVIGLIGVRRRTIRTA